MNEVFGSPLVVALVVGAVSGTVSMAGTLAALRVHIHYLVKMIDKAHDRIDKNEARITKMQIGG